MPNINFSVIYINNILHKIRQYIAKYIKETYIIEDISTQMLMKDSQLINVYLFQIVILNLG